MAEIDFRTLRESEREAFLALMDVGFPDEDVLEFARYLDEDPNLGFDDTLVAFESGRLVSAVQIFTRTIRLRGEPVALGGIGSVVTHPDRRSRGLSTELLRRAITEMRARGMALSLLFTGRFSFYERLGWVRIDHGVEAVRRTEPASRVGRPFAEADLPAIQRIYTVYSAPRDGATIRDADYWRGQLRFAGSPDEDFRVLERGGEIVAYARRIEFMEMSRIMEMGCIEDATDALGALLLEMTPDDSPLCVPACDARVDEVLVALGASLEAVAFPGQMWRVLDGDRLRDLVPASDSLDDAALLTALVSTSGFVYWPADRF